MTIYFTKVWGFHEPAGPLQFSENGWRERAKDVLRPGDLTVYVGTKTIRTEKADQGRVLGMVEPTNEPVMSLDFDLPKPPEHLDEEGNYRWPYALQITRAWRFPDRPLFSDITDRHFTREGARGIVALTKAEEDRVHALRREDVPLLPRTASAQARLDRVAGRSTKSAPAPPTESTSRRVMHVRWKEAYTYALEVVGAEPAAYKIGWAFDYRRRARQFNQAAMPNLGGLEYRPVLEHLWDTARQAYRMERRLLTHFDAHRHPSNNEIIFDVGYDELVSAWARHVETNPR